MQLLLNAQSLGSTKKRSMARQSSSDDMSLCEEWKEKAPLFYSFLISSALSGRQKDVNTVTWLPSVALAGSVLLRERFRAMETTIIKSSGS